MKLKNSVYLKVATAVLAASAANAEYLRDLVDESDFRIGVAANNMYFSNKEYMESLKNFNYMVAENGCKMDSMYDYKNQLTFAACDAHYEKAKELNMDFRGHVLIWHSQPAAWMTKLSGDELREAITNHVTEVLQHYEGKIDSWDVVNEVISDSSTGNEEKGWKMRGEGANESSFLYEGAEDFVDVAFKAARAASTAKLFINDYGNERIESGKGKSFYNFVADLKKRNIPVDGVGLQYHVNTNYYPAYNDINTLIGKYCDLGLEVHITEIDVVADGDGRSKKQAQVYSDALKACLNNECCTAYLVWGVSDQESWITKQYANQKKTVKPYPLILDDNYEPKPAYNSIYEVLRKKFKPDLNDEEEVTEETVSVGSLASKAGKLKIGTTVTLGKMGNPDYVKALKNFNYMVSDYDCKFGNIHPAKGYYNYDNCRNSLNRATELGLEMGGRSLIWCNYQPAWFQNLKDDRDELMAEIKEFVTKTVKEFDGQIKEWDVIEEVIDNYIPSGMDWKIRDSFLYPQELASEEPEIPKYVKVAFAAARQASPKTKLLYLEDFLSGTESKADAIYKFVNRMIEEGVEIDGVDIQLHPTTKLYPSYEKMSGMIGGYCDLGLDVHLAIDVQYAGTENDSEIQSNIFADILNACLDNECCTHFLVNGIGDADTWMSKEKAPLLFTDTYEEKESYRTLYKTLGERNCGGLYSQCGGIGYNGNSCCNEGICLAVNDYYHHCVKTPEMNNEEMIQKLKDIGLSELELKYALLERPIQKKFANIKVNGMKFNVKHYEVVGVGNLVVMDISSPNYAMLTYVLTPYYKDVPIFSTDFVFQGENRQIINEIYSIVSDTTSGIDPSENTVYNEYIKKLKINMNTCHLNDVKSVESWIDEYRPIYINKIASVQNDQEIIGLFLSNLKLIVNFEQASPYLGVDDKISRFNNIKEFIDKLISEGGISTDMFKKALGEKTTKEFFYTLFYGNEIFKPYFST